MGVRGREQTRRQDHQLGDVNCVLLLPSTHVHAHTHTHTHTPIPREICSQSPYMQMASCVSLLKVPSAPRKELGWVDKHLSFLALQEEFQGMCSEVSQGLPNKFFPIAHSIDPLSNIFLNSPALPSFASPQHLLGCPSQNLNQKKKKKKGRWGCTAVLDNADHESHSKEQAGVKS